MWAPRVDLQTKSINDYYRFTGLEGVCVVDVWLKGGPELSADHKALHDRTAALMLRFTFVCVIVGRITWKSYVPIFMKLGEEVGRDPEKNPLNVRTDPAYSFQIQIRIWLNDVGSQVTYVGSLWGENIQPARLRGRDDAESVRREQCWRILNRYGSQSRGRSRP